MLPLAVLAAALAGAGAVSQQAREARLEASLHRLTTFWCEEFPESGGAMAAEALGFAFHPNATLHPALSSVSVANWPAVAVPAVTAVGMGGLCPIIEHVVFQGTEWFAAAMTFPPWTKNGCAHPHRRILFGRMDEQGRMLEMFENNPLDPAEFAGATDGKPRECRRSRPPPEQVARHRAMEERYLDFTFNMAQDVLLSKNFEAEQLTVNGDPIARATLHAMLGAAVGHSPFFVSPIQTHYMGPNELLIEATLVSRATEGPCKGAVLRVPYVIDYVTFDKDDNIAAARVFGGDALFAHYAKCAAMAAAADPGRTEL